MTVTVFNRTAAKADPLLAKGAKRAASAAEAAKPGGVAITMVADDAALESLTIGDHGLAARLGKGGIHLSMSTVSPAISRRLAEYHAQRGSTYLAAPVFGRPERAQVHQLWIVISGASEAKARVRPILDAMGRQIFDMGEDPGAANVLKLVGNFMIVSAIEAISEGLALAEKSGLDRAAVAAMLSSTLLACPLYQGYFNTIVKRAFEPAGFKMQLGLKDVELVLRLGSETRVPVPMASMVRDRALANLARGRAEMDWSAIALGALEDAGIKTS
jgi:3-hydroxyisobutyrate dehydrogenase-like beta-hydroxyacid dehydrogenase